MPTPIILSEDLTDTTELIHPDRHHCTVNLHHVKLNSNNVRGDVADGLVQLRVALSRLGRLLIPTERVRLLNVGEQPDTLGQRRLHLRFHNKYVALRKLLNDE